LICALSAVVAQPTGQAAAFIYCNVKAAEDEQRNEATPLKFFSLGDNRGHPQQRLRERERERDRERERERERE
jgi:hypothetical protein